MEDNVLKNRNDVFISLIVSMSLISKKVTYAKKPQMKINRLKKQKHECIMLLRVNCKSGIAIFTCIGSLEITHTDPLSTNLARFANSC